MNNITIADYHRADGISKSGLDEINVSPLHYWNKYLNPNREPEERTPAMIQGAAFHMAVGEPGEFERLYVRMPDGMIRRGASWEDFKEHHKNKEILSADTFDEVMRWRDAMVKHPIYRGVIEGRGQFEKSFFWKDELTGELCRCRPDFLSNDGVIVDFKTTRSAKLDSFSRDAVNMRYHVQSAFYLDGVTAAMKKAELVGPFLFIAIEKEAPYAVSVCEADGDFVCTGRQEYQMDLQTYAACKKLNEWPGYPLTVQTLSLPKWYKTKINEGVIYE